VRTAPAWASAVAAYRARFAGKSPVFDEELIRATAALSDTPDEAAPPSSLAAEVRAALEEAAPPYRASGWADDDRANRFWMAVARTLLDEAGSELVAAHEKAYGVRFPARVRVDVAAFGGEFGAYTTGPPDRAQVVITSREPDYAGFHALEMLMHEPSHVVVGWREGAIGPELEAAARRLGLRTPRNLWHGILFYTSGELTRRALAARGVAGYTPHIEGMYERGMRPFREAFRTTWQAYLEERMSRAEAVEAIVRTVGLPPSPAPSPSPSPRG
jgi:hypothetical protein